MQRSLFRRSRSSLLNATHRWFARSSGATTQPNPAPTYADARARLHAIERSEPPHVIHACRYQALLHPERRPDVVIFLHGFTNCPQQFRALGQRLFARGYNVLLPRLPGHGVADRLTRDQAQLTAAHLVALVDQAIDIAQGLGERVTLVGISAGAVAAAWAAQQRSDLDHAVLIAPALGYAGAPALFARVITQIFLWWPNQFIWWDRTQKEQIPGPLHAYPRFSTRAVGQIFSLGRAVLNAAAQSAPRTREISVVTSAADVAVNRLMIAELVRRWQAHGEQTVFMHEFPAQMSIIHDMIDPDQRAQQIDVVYPVLLDIITRGGSNGAVAH